jgi:RAB protein geranylgeranyltransferase component A
MSESAGGASLGSPQNRFYLDLTGPKVALCVGPLINALLKLQAEHHVKFMAIESSYIWRDHAIAAVPASRSDVFQDQSLSLPDKQFLMQFFKMNYFVCDCSFR